KADRQRSTLIIRNLVMEPGTKVDDALVAALNRGLASFTDANHCHDLQIERCSPRELKQQLSINLN
ncbi:MAG: winged helix-turn-helix domain-containing protein, partial [Gammaproteobacteria bacterium]